MIKVIDNNDQITEMDIITIYDIPDNPYHYIIYLSQDNEFYIGKFIGEEVADLITDLTEEEIKYATDLLNNLIGE